MRKSKMTKLIIKAGELARKYNDAELDRILTDALLHFSELDALVYGIELELEKYTESEDADCGYECSINALLELGYLER